MLKLLQIVPYVIFNILVYKIFEILSLSDFRLLFVIFSKIFLLITLINTIGQASLHENWPRIIAEAVFT